jgi:hypothetical protein
MPSHAFAALLFVLASLPAFAAAHVMARGALPVGGNLRGLSLPAQRVLNTRLAFLMRCVGTAILACAGGIWLAGGDATLTTAFVVGMAIVVNLFIVAMLLAIRRIRQDDRNAR